MVKEVLPSLPQRACASDLKWGSDQPNPQRRKGISLFVKALALIFLAPIPSSGNEKGPEGPLLELFSVQPDGCRPIIDEADFHLGPKATLFIGHTF